MQITNLTVTKIDKNSLLKTADIVSAVLGISQDISLVLIGDAKMRELNKKYRGKNATTDVLSFEGLNEIFISLPQAKRQTRNNPSRPPLTLRGGEIPPLKLRGGEGELSPLNCELTRLLVHGIVHLVGYDHEKSSNEAERMFRVEEKILMIIK